MKYIDSVYEFLLFFDHSNNDINTKFIKNLINDVYNKLEIKNAETKIDISTDGVYLDIIIYLHNTENYNLFKESELFTNLKRILSKKYHHLYEEEESEEKLNKKESIIELTLKVK